jgi:hypothetical protein
VVAVTSGVTTTSLGLQRLQGAQEDTYEPGTAPPRAHQRSIDALDALDPEVEDTRVLHLSTSTHATLEVDRIDVLVSWTEIELIE